MIEKIKKNKKILDNLKIICYYDIKV